MATIENKRTKNRPLPAGLAAGEVLRLSAEEEAYMKLRLKLAEGLKARRIDKGLSQVQLARAVRSSQIRTPKAGDPVDALTLRLHAES